MIGAGSFVSWSSSETCGELWVGDLVMIEAQQRGQATLPNLFLF